MTDPLDLSIIALHMIARIALTWMTVRILYYYFELLNLWQRIGLGLLGGLSFLTVPVVYDAYTVASGTPFDAWAGCGATIGMICFLYGTLIRVKRHSQANQQQIFHAQDHLKGRGKL